MATIARSEGFGSLWRGLSPTLALTLPQTAIYFIMYENLKDGIISELIPGSYAPALSGIIARSTWCDLRVREYSLHCSHL